MENIFESKEQIIELIQRADNEVETKRLTKKFKQLKKERKEFYLTLAELEEIFKWKLRSQYGRQTKQRSVNTDKNIISITRTAFEVIHPDEEYETKLKLKTFNLNCCS